MTYVATWRPNERDYLIESDDAPEIAPLVVVRPRQIAGGVEAGERVAKLIAAVLESDVRLRAHDAFGGKAGS